MKINIEKLAKEALEGKTLTNVQHGFMTNAEEAEENGERFLPLPAKIEKVRFGTDCERDPIIYLELEGHEDSDEDFNVYIDEDITVV